MKNIFLKSTAFTTKRKHVLYKTSFTKISNFRTQASDSFLQSTRTHQRIQ